MEVGRTFGLKSLEGDDDYDNIVTMKELTSLV